MSPLETADALVYEQLAELTSEQLVAVQAGDLDRLEQLSTRWSDLVAELPADAPAHARAALERTVACHDQIGVALRELRSQLGGELILAGRGRRTATGYGAEAGAAQVSRQA